MIKSPSNEKDKLIAELNELMKPQPRPQPRRYESYTANKIMGKLLLSGGVVVIIGLLMYIIGKDSNKNNNNCRCD